MRPEDWQAPINPVDENKNSSDPSSSPFGQQPPRLNNAVPPPPPFGSAVAQPAPARVETAAPPLNSAFQAPPQPAAQYQGQPQYQAPAPQPPAPQPPAPALPEIQLEPEIQVQTDSPQAAPKQPAQAPPIPPVPPAGGGSSGKGRSGPPPRREKRGMGWPMAFLLLGLAMIGGCVYTMGSAAESIFSAAEVKTNQPSLGVLVMENEIFGSVWATDVVNKFKEDPNIKGVVIRVNSPGGAVAPCQEIYQAVKALKKPVVVSMGSVAASGGLYIAAAGDVIMANPGTITGSIGVIMQSVEVSGTMDKLGLKSQTIKSGEFKDMGSPFRSMKADERELLQNMVNEVYEQFVADLSEGRKPKGKSAEDIRKIADGRIFTGAKAKELGLVDELGGFEDAVMLAAKMSGLPAGKRPNLVVEDGRKPWWETAMYSKFSGGETTISLPPALTPGFSIKYMYQPDLGSAPANSGQGS